MSDVSPPRGFARFERRAERKAAEPVRVAAIARAAQQKWLALKPALTALREDLPVLIRLSLAYATGAYRRLPWKGIVGVIAAVLYFLSPIDAIPDFIPVIGYLDDAAVVAYVMRMLGDEVARFRAWEEGDI